jgi:uncharacterized protein DUF5615
MKIKLDENLPLGLAVALRELGHDVHTLFDEQLAGQADADIWDATQKESRFLVTQDLDFSDMRKFAPRVTSRNSACAAAFAKPKRLGGADRRIVSD